MRHLKYIVIFSCYFTCNTAGIFLTKANHACKVKSLEITISKLRQNLRTVRLSKCEARNYTRLKKRDRTLSLHVFRRSQT